MIIEDEKILRLPCEDVRLDEVDNLVSLLENELNYLASINRPGIGLAATQIGIHKKIAIIRLEHLSLNLVNATIDKMYDPIIFKNEGCLSFPDKVIDTKRYNEIYVSNNLVEPYGFIAKGLLSIAVQHELDHCAGKLFMDRQVEPPKIKVKMRPNDKCYCLSNRKYKHCHGKDRY